jgi:hypothetical protein
VEEVGERGVPVRGQGNLVILRPHHDACTQLKKLKS